MSDARRIAVLTSFSGDGGVERVTVNLLSGLIDRGVAVDLLLSRAAGPFVPQIPAPVTVIKLASDHARFNVLQVARYLRAAPLAAMLAIKHRSVVTAVWARSMSASRVRLVGCIHTNVSAAIRGKSRLRAALWRRSMKVHYHKVDALVAVSRGVADDVARMSGLGPDRLVVISNPVVSRRLYEQAEADPPHPWLSGQTDVPVIMGVGRLTEQKDFETLIRAFARVRKVRRCRLIILGRGGMLERLQTVARDAAVIEDVAFTGFVANPYAYLARAQLFVLSSRWEGSPMVLTEALALGVPVVATDCPSGPREILEDGRYGPLVPVGDVERLAAAMEATLASPPDPLFLRAAAAAYTVDASAQRYLSVLGLL